jgi:hypothetical protein
LVDAVEPHWALLSTLVVICTGQTPEPSATPLVAMPLKTPRHLEYRYHVTYHESGEVHDSGMSGGGVGGNGSGVVATFGSGGREGAPAKPTPASCTVTDA